MHNVTGNWKGYFETNIIPHTDIYLKLRQANTKITGSMTGQGGITGEFKGTIDGNALEFELKTTVPFCPGKYSGTAILSDDSSEIELSTMTGRDCFGEQKDGYGFVTRQ